MSFAMMTMRRPVALRRKFEEGGGGEEEGDGPFIYCHIVILHSHWQYCFVVGFALDILFDVVIKGNGYGNMEGYGT